MNKALERAVFDSVFGGRFSSEIIESEIPDFLIKDPEGITLGVEVTEIYTDFTDARLKNQEGYLDGLLAGTQKIFRADKGMMDVDEIKILREDGQVFSVETAVIRGVPTFKESMNLLEQAIREKNLKAPTYLASCDQVDLIVSDASGIFNFKKDEDFYRSFFHTLDRNLIKNLQFREIYFIYHSIESDKKSIPIKLNSFMCDLLSLHYTFLADNKEIDSSENESTIILLLALYELGHQDFSFSISEKILIIDLGAWVLEFETERTNVKDHTNLLSPRKKEKLISDAYDGADESDQLAAQKLANKRWNNVAYVTILFPLADAS